MVFVGALPEGTAVGHLGAIGAAREVAVVAERPLPRLAAPAEPDGHRGCEDIAQSVPVVRLTVERLHRRHLVTSGTSPWTM